MVGRGDDDAVDILAAEDLAVVLGRLGRSAQLLRRLLAPRNVDIRDGDHIDIGRRSGVARYAAPPAAGADQRHAHAIVRA